MKKKPWPARWRIFWKRTGNLGEISVIPGYTVSQSRLRRRAAHVDGPQRKAQPVTGRQGLGTLAHPDGIDGAYVSPDRRVLVALEIPAARAGSPAALR